MNVADAAVEEARAAAAKTARPAPPIEAYASDIELEGETAR